MSPDYVIISELGDGSGIQFATCHRNRLAVSVESTGERTDIPNSYTISVDGGQPIALAVPQSPEPYTAVEVVRYLGTGDHTVALTVPDNCTVTSGSSSIPAQVLEDETTNVGFTVDCQPSGVPPSTLEGDLLDEDDATVLVPDADKPIVVRASSPGGSLVPVPLAASGHYLFDPVALPGTYSVSMQGVIGLRFVSTDGESVDVSAGSAATKDLRITTGYHLAVENGPFQRTAAAGDPLDLDIDYHVWNRVNLPGAVTWLVIAVEGDAQAVHRVGIAGGHASQNAEATGTASVRLTAPAQTGRIFAYLAAVSTGTEAEQIYERDFPARVNVNYVHIGDITIP